MSIYLPNRPIVKGMNWIDRFNAKARFYRASPGMNGAASIYCLTGRGDLLGYATNEEDAWKLAKEKSLIRRAVYFAGRR